jgi:polyvinyl alcohol dehydrogenase (cytochrome)
MSNMSIIIIPAKAHAAQPRRAHAIQLRWRAVCLLLMTLTVSMSSLTAPARADWPVFGHDLGNSRSAGSDGPSPAEAAALQQAWTFSSSNGDFTGTPVIADGTLIAGTNLGTVYALDPVTGKVRWSRNLGQPINGSAAIDPNAPGGATAFVPVAQLNGPRLLALSLSSGAVRWDRTLTTQSGADVFSSPVYWHGAIYIGTSGPGNDESTARGSVVALDEASGRIRWQTFTVPPGHDGGGVWSTPTIDPATGRLYVGTGNAYHDPAAETTDSIMALDARSGQILGHFQSTAGDVWEVSSPSSGPDWDFGASPNLISTSSGRQLVGDGQKSGTYWALDRATLKPVWHTSVGPGSQADGGIGSTAYDDRRIYGSDSVNAEVFALDHQGSMVWNSTDGGTLHVSPVAVGNGVVYSATSGGFLLARDETTGNVLNRLSLGAPTFGGISIVGHAAYVAVGTGPPSPLLPLPSNSTSQGDGNGTIVAFGDPSANAGSSQFSLKFSNPKLHTATAATLHGVIHRSSPNAKPSGLRSLVLDLPAGARFNGSATPPCTASDQQIQRQGPSACPAASQVGGGTFQVAAGLPTDPETVNVTIFNWGKGTLEVVTAPGSNSTLAIDRGDFTGPGELTDHPPKAPGGPPDFETTVSQADFTYRQVVGPGGQAFITTPAACPANRVWTSRIRYSTADGRSYAAASTTPCRPASRAKPHPHAIRIRLHPASVAAGTIRVIRVRVSSPHRACVQGVTVRIRRQQARTNARGWATLRIRDWRSGRYLVSAHKPGCGTAHAHVNVVPRRRQSDPESL